MAEKQITRLDWWPDWFTGKTINEPVFCRAFLADHPLACMENGFYSPEGKLADENSLRAEIYRMLEPFVATDVSKKVDSIMRDLRLKSRVDELPPQPDRIHVQNGTLFLDGTFTEQKNEIVRSRFPARYDPSAEPPEPGCNSCQSCFGRRTSRCFRSSSATL